MTEIELINGIKILFSYKTPIAYIEPIKRKIVKTKKFWSNTTTKHINYWLDIDNNYRPELGDILIETPQKELDNLISKIETMGI